MRTKLARVASFIALATVSQFSLDAAQAADSGLITQQSKYSAEETARRFEEAVKAKGWVSFARIDHAAAARQAGLELKPRTVIIFGNPKGGTAPMQRAPTLAIDNPPKALVWQDDADKVWLTYNSAEYHLRIIFPRHGHAVPPPEAIAGYAQLLADVSRQATE
jgi:uncharacterized protein (DUF302 family)